VARGSAGPAAAAWVAAAQVGEVTAVEGVGAEGDRQVWREAEGATAVVVWERAAGVKGMAGAVRVQAAAVWAVAVRAAAATGLAEAVVAVAVARARAARLAVQAVQGEAAVDERGEAAGRAAAARAAAGRAAAARAAAGRGPAARGAAGRVVAVAVAKTARHTSRSARRESECSTYRRSRLRAFPPRTWRHRT